jgi:transcriptional regulator
VIPTRIFGWHDEAELRAFVADTAFAQIVGSRADGRLVSAQAPLVPAADGSFRFHLARANAAVPDLDGALVLASVIGTHFYVSPDWYGAPDQVPTWNYRMVEIEGIARRLTADEAREQVDSLSAVHEAALAPKPAWTSAKMEARVRERLLAGIVGFAIERPVLRGTAKLGQNKPERQAAGVIAALRARGDTVAADAMAAAR